MPVALALALSVLLGSPVIGGALSAVQIAALAGMALQNAPGIIAFDVKVWEFVNSPAFRAMAAANGEAAIKWQERQQENRNGP